MPQRRPGDIDVDWHPVEDERRHSDDDDCVPYTCSRCRTHFTHYDDPPVLAWPQGPEGKGVPNRKGNDIIMYRFCSDCSEIVMRRR